jgi:hypothetical protein
MIRKVERSEIQTLAKSRPVAFGMASYERGEVISDQ